jgi:heme-degrading monooxygenase HmoA
MTFRVLLRMEVAPGAAPAFERVWHEGADVITGQPANLGQWLCRSEDEPDVYHIISDWTDEASFREYEHSDQHLAHRQTLHPYRLRGSMATATVLADLPGAARTGGAAR